MGGGGAVKWTRVFITVPSRPWLLPPPLICQCLLITQPRLSPIDAESLGDSACQGKSATPSPSQSRAEQSERKVGLRESRQPRPRASLAPRGCITVSRPRTPLSGGGEPPAPSRAWCWGSSPPESHRAHSLSHCSLSDTPHPIRRLQKSGEGLFQFGGLSETQ